jgi:hypothetical protein
MQIADSLLAGSEQFRVDTNLSRKIEGPTRFAELPTSAKDDFRRTGLAWMTALARVELGAMLAGFTTVPRPFKAVAPTEFDQSEFGELLMDAYRTHFWAFQKDPAVKQFRSRGMPFQKLIPYGRRTQMIHRFREAAIEMFGLQMTQAQKGELISQAGEVRQAELAFLYCYAKSHTSQRESTIGDHFIACPPLAKAARREIQTRRPTAVQGKSPDLSMLLILKDPTLASIPCY